MAGSFFHFYRHSGNEAFQDSALLFVLDHQAACTETDKTGLIEISLECSIWKS